VSVAVHDTAGGLCGVVLDPLRDELFAGERGGVATCNGRPLSGSTCSDLASSLVATGFSYDAAVRATQAEVLTRLLPAVSDVRRMGGAALEMAWTAAGRYDAFYERGIAIWDTAAGSVLCRCAGVDVRPLEGRPGAPPGVLAAPPALIGELARIVG
jgi:myo-inositol-1(or 4)-monophosphatase